jgi:hypothetical protein
MGIKMQSNSLPTLPIIDNRNPPKPLTPEDWRKHKREEPKVNVLAMTPEQFGKFFGELK